jgi:protein-L-isoaspartate(D-aspartate) O-methyltransferase
VSRRCTACETISAVTGATEASRGLAEAVRAAGVRDARLLSAIAEIPRGHFVPPEKTAGAYLDEPVPIPRGQVTTQPSLVAQMIEALALRGDENVLEIGTGYGWQTALLARQAGAVWSIERWSDLAEVARANLERAGIAGAHVVVRDGTEGLPEHAPFDAIVVTAAFTSVPPPLGEQLAERGRLVQPIGPGGHDDVTLFAKRGERLVEVGHIVPARFVRLYGRHGYAEDG